MRRGLTDIVKFRVWVLGNLAWMPGGRQCLQRWRGGRGCRRARGCTAPSLPRRSLLTRPLWLWASDEGSRLPHHAHTSVGGVPSECRASNPGYAPPLCGSRVDDDPKRRGGLHSPAESPADKTGSEIPPALTSLAWTGWWGCGGCVCFLGLSQVVRGVAAPHGTRRVACSFSVAGTFAVAPAGHSGRVQRPGAPRGPQGVRGPGAVPL